MSYDGVSVIFSPVGTRWRVLRRILAEEVCSLKALKAFEPNHKQQVCPSHLKFYLVDDVYWSDKLVTAKIDLQFLPSPKY